MTLVIEHGLRSRLTAAIGLPIGLMILAVVGLTGCQSSTRGVNGTVGAGTGVALSTAGDVTQLLVGQSLGLQATVTSDPTGAGVVWTLAQDTSGGVPTGTLIDQTATTATFVAPTTTFVGATSATITATSKSDPTFASSVTIITSGTAKFNSTQLFPANVNVPYAASVSVSGGTSPFTWSLASGSASLPPGLILNGSTTGLDQISGTPTSEGTYAGIIVQVVDSAATPATITQTLTITVGAQQACIVTGDFALQVTGFRGGGPMTHVAHLTINADGSITGEQDYKDGHTTYVDVPIQGTSTCTNRQTNSGYVTLNASNGQQTQYNFSLTPPDANNVIQSARLQLVGSAADTASGLMQRVDDNAINTTTPPVGNFAFGLLGEQNQEPNVIRSATAGRFTTTDASGAITAGLVDSNVGSGLAAATLNGTLTAPDALGRGQATLTYGGQTWTYAYYTVNAGKRYLMNIDAQSVGKGIPRSSGFMTSQVPNVGTVFDNTALNTPSIITLWGGVIGTDPITVMTMGLLSGSVPAANVASGTINGLLDVSYRDTPYPGVSYAAQPFSIDPSGRGTVTLTLPTLSLLNYNLAFYLDGASSGYVVQEGGAAGAGGLLEAQYSAPVGGFPSSLDGFFVGGTQFAMAAGPITLTPLATLNFGSLSSSFTNGTFYVDGTNGRGFGTLQQNGVGTQPASIYIVSPTKVDLLRFGTRAIDGNVDWLLQDLD